MNRLSIWKQDNAQISAVHLCDWSPSPDAPVLLDHFANRIGHDMHNPLQTDHNPVRSLVHRMEILGEFHGSDYGMLRSFRMPHEMASRVIRPATTGQSRQSVWYSAIFSSVAWSWSFVRPSFSASRLSKK